MPVDVFKGEVINLHACLAGEAPIKRSTVTLVALLRVLPVRFATCAVKTAVDFNRTFLPARSNVADVKDSVPYSSSAFPSVALLPELIVRLLSERVAAEAWSGLNVPAAPAITRFDVELPVNVPAPLTVPFRVRVLPFSISVAEGSMNTFCKVISLLRAGIVVVKG